MIRARSARLRRVVAARTHVVSCARSLAATANFVATAMPSLHHAIIRMASELTRRDTRWSLSTTRQGSCPVSRPRALHRVRRGACDGEGNHAENRITDAENTLRAAIIAYYKAGGTTTGQSKPTPYPKAETYCGRCRGFRGLSHIQADNR